MLDKIKRLGVETAVYGISTIFGRFLSFLLLPLYVNVLSTSDYGVVANVYSYIAFFNILYGCGMEAAYFKFASSKELSSEKQIFGAAWLSIIATGALLSLFIITNLSSVTSFVARAGDESVIFYAVGILFSDSLSLIPFAALRLQKRPWNFAGVRVASIALNLILNLILLIKFKMGLHGVFLSGLLSSMFTTLLLLPVILKNISFHFDRSKLKQLLRFGTPTIPAGIAGIALQVVDRPILRALTTDTAVGIYSANYRLGIFMMLIVSMFDYAWRPFFLSNASEKNAKEIFARVTTYFFLLMMFMFLAVSLFIDNIVRIEIFHRHLIHPAYWSGLPIVPIVLLAYVFTGLYVLFLPGIYIHKKTSLLPISTGIGAVINIVMNILVIPSMGIAGAAWASLVGYGAMACSLFIITQKFYPVKYEYRRLGIIAFVTGTCYGFFRILASTSIPLILTKILILICFAGLMILLKFFEPSELRQLYRIFKRRSIQPNDSTQTSITDME